VIGEFENPTLLYRGWRQFAIAFPHSTKPTPPRPEHDNSHKQNRRSSRGRPGWISKDQHLEPQEDMAHASKRQDNILTPNETRGRRLRRPTPRFAKRVGGVIGFSKTVGGHG